MLNDTSINKSCPLEARSFSHGRGCMAQFPLPYAQFVQQKSQTQTTQRGNPAKRLEHSQRYTRTPATNVLIAIKGCQAQRCIITAAAGKAMAIFFPKEF
jgi:hypothetical protein